MLFIGKKANLLRSTVVARVERLLDIIK